MDVFGEEVPDIPAKHVLDKAGLFRSNPKDLEELEGKLVNLQKKQGFPLYLVIEGTLINSNGPVVVDNYQKAWIGEGPGIVILMEADAGKFNISQPQDNGRTLAPGQPLLLSGPLDLSAVEITQIAGDAMDRGRAARNRDDKIRLVIDFCGGFADSVEQLLIRRATPQKDQTMKPLIEIFIGAFAVTAVLLLIAYAVMRRSEHRQHTRYVFPTLQVGQRLGAQYGGGKVISRRF